MGRPEKGDSQRATVALKAVAQSRERTMQVHPLAEVAEYLSTRLVTVERF
jgi:hypothetical protein